LPAWQEIVDFLTAVLPLDRRMRGASPPEDELINSIRVT
jgi:hypothetical protein